jgi:hypothetical protein
MDAQARTETLIGHNRALLRRAAGTWAYSPLVFDETAETVLMAYVAQLRARYLLLLRRRMQRHDGGPSAPSRPADATTAAAAGQRVRNWSPASLAPPGRSGGSY